MRFSLHFYTFKKNTDVINILANMYQIMYGISSLEEKPFNSFDSKYMNSELIKTIIVSISAKNGLLIVKKKNEKNWFET